jgi:hypothetical protein
MNYGRRFPFKMTKSTKEGPAPVPVRVPPTDRIRRHIDELFAQDRPLSEILDEVAPAGRSVADAGCSKPRSPSFSAVIVMPAPR